MGRRGVTEQEAFDAADALLEEGEEPTVRLVQERTGGSYSTITRHMDKWREQRAEKAPAHIPDMPDNVMAGFRQVWATAARTAQKDMETERQALEAVRREMEQDKADMAAEIERLEKELDEAGRKAEALESELETERRGRAAAEKQATELRIENARLDERAKAAEGRAGELKEQVEGLQAKFAEVARQAEPKGRTRPKASKPEPG